MATFIAFERGVEVNGQTVLTIVNGMDIFKKRAYQILAENGIRDPKPGKWYSQQAWLNAFKTIAQSIGPYTLYRIGSKIPENAQFPPEIDSIEKALASIDVAYHMNHRKGEIGHYNYEKTGERTAQFVCNNPYPCTFDKGIIEAMGRKFKPKDSTNVLVKHDDTAPCRNKGADSCTYMVRW